jgi:hypothetical protein
MCKQGSSIGHGPQWLNFVSHLIFNEKNGYGFTDWEFPHFYLIYSAR